MSSMEHSEPGYMIAGMFYPMPTRYRLGDPVLVTELTGMDFIEFAEALDDPRNYENPVIQIGLIGVAVWQKYPRWKRVRVVEFVQAIEQNSVDFEAGASTAGPDDLIPPADAGQGSSLPTSPATSTESPAAPAEPSTLPATGEPG